MVTEPPSISLSIDALEDLPASFLDIGWYHFTTEQGRIIREQYMKCYKEYGVDLVIAPYIESDTNIRRLGIALRKRFSSKVQPELVISVLLHFGPNLEVIPQLLYPDNYGPPSSAISLHLSNPERFLSMKYFPFAEEPDASTDCSRLLGYLTENFSDVFPAVYLDCQWKLDPALPADSPLSRETLYNAFYNCYLQTAHQIANTLCTLRDPIADNKSLINYAVRCAGVMNSSLSAIHTDIDRYAQGDAISAAIECYEEYLETPLAVSYRSYHSSLALLEHILHKPSTTEADPTAAIAFLIGAATASYKTFTQK
ncbi:Hypothetical protein GLP15_159 [Giardia lamblia P15]|uniref:Uncharacterized protein n=1 Tax=Giardia intestinalis (strain P15) TaxID=658858 RepID=E1EY49_GIAIA|nr:Hypothetical protein GLP15_159 [Giardia lamblia P15]